MFGLSHKGATQNYNLRTHDAIFQRDSNLFVFRIWGYCLKSRNQKYLQSDIQTKTMETNYRTGKGKTKTELVKEKIRELSKNLSFYPSRNYKI